MLILLTLGYCGIIWLIFFKLKLLPWNKVSRNIAIGVGVAGLTAVLIGLVQGSPSSRGGIQVNTRVMSLTAHSFGRVTEVAADTYQPLKKGEVILRVDPAQYELRVTQLEAALVAAVNGVEQMKEALAAAQADVKNVDAQIETWGSTMKAATAGRESAAASLAAAEAAREATQAEVAANESNVKTAQLQIVRIRDLVAKDVESQSSLDNAENKVVSTQAGLAVAQAMERKAAEDVAVRAANLEGAKASEQQTKDQRASLQAQLVRAKAVAHQAQLQLESTVDGEHTSIRQAKAQLADARYDLENTVVLAPADGFVVALGVTEGDYLRMVSFGTFVVSGHRFATAMFDQSVVRHIKPGQAAEIAFRNQPGRIVPAEVDRVVWAAGEAQVPTTGTIPMVNQIGVARRIGVRFKLLETEGFEPQFGASGEVAVYTDHAKPISVIRKIVLRITSLMYYLGIG